MKTTIYILPGFGETCSETRYKKLDTVLKSKGYIVERVKPNWYKPLSANVFKPKKNSILIGFSFGAIVAYLIAIKYPVSKVIFCSMSPITTYKDFYESYLAHMDEENSRLNAEDITKIKISLDKLKTPHITLAGEKENLKANLLVPKTGHYMSIKYINCLTELLTQ
jgi:alpha/beta superfamily hydrolase